MEEPPSRQELEAAHCWEPEDRVPGSPEMTAFRQTVRLRQARWREANGHPMGTQPINPSATARTRLVGSRLPLEYARTTGANFVGPAAFTAARTRVAAKEPHQSLDAQRMWADLLWSPALACNCFGDLARDLARADRAVHTWWPDTPGRVVDVRFAYSPGWLDPAYLGSLVAFDTAFVLDLADGTKGIVAVDVKYREACKAETPKPERLDRYRTVAGGSGAFAPGAIDALSRRSELAVTWLEHLLLLSMLQHPSGEWRWGRYVVVAPEANTDITVLGTRYRELLADDATFATMTLERLVVSRALPRTTTAALRGRYLGR